MLKHRRDPTPGGQNSLAAQATELAPGAPVTPAVNQCQDVGKLAREQLERLKARHADRGVI